MSDEMDSFEAEGIQAFNAMTAAMDRLGATLTAVDERQQGRRFREDQEGSAAFLAASEAKNAAAIALQAARASARSVASWAVLGALAGVLVAGGAGYWLGHSGGRESGLADGYRSALDQNAAASWANTPSGRLAFDLDQLGSLSLVMGCSGQGWHTETQHGRRYCFGGPAPDGHTYGWPLP
jgi:hypothetical protein